MKTNDVLKRHRRFTISSFLSLDLTQSQIVCLCVRLRIGVHHVPSKWFSFMFFHHTGEDAPVMRPGLLTCQTFCTIAACNSRPQLLFVVAFLGRYTHPPQPATNSTQTALSLQEHSILKRLHFSECSQILQSVCIQKLLDQKMGRVS